MPDLPDVLFLRPSRLKWGLIAGGGAVFAGVGIWLVLRGEGFMAWACVAFGALVFLTGLAHIFTTRVGLALSADGFEIRGLMGRNWNERWVTCSPFFVGTISHNKMVMFERACDQGKLGASIVRGLAGAPAALPDTYGMSAHALADMMNDWRTRAIAQDCHGGDKN